MPAEGDGLCRQVLAVTGGIGSGKSRVARWLADECALPLYDADAEVRTLLTPHEAGWLRLRTWLSPDYFADDGTLLKAKLRQAIFQDTELRLMVEHDLHPLVLANLQGKIRQGPCPCLVEVPLLYEVGWQGYFARVLVVYASPEVCCRRVALRDRLSPEAAQAAIAVQMPIMEKVRLADYTVDNSGPWGETVCQLEKIKKMWSPQLGEKA